MEGRARRCLACRLAKPELKTRKDVITKGWSSFSYPSSIYLLSVSYLFALPYLTFVRFLFFRGMHRGFPKRCGANYVSDILKLLKFRSATQNFWILGMAPRNRCGAEEVWCCARKFGVALRKFMLGFMRLIEM